MTNDSNITNEKPVALSGTSQSAGGSATTFSWDTARLMAKYAAAAYVSHTVCDVYTDATALVTEVADPSTGSGLVISFQGSREPKDFVQDSKCDLRYLMWRPRYSGDNYVFPRVHAGFLEDFQAIEADVVRMVRVYVRMHQPAKVYITGHSLGAALAQLCALSLSIQSLPVTAVYTFGGPRVGDGLFARRYSEHIGGRTFRLVNANDIVPRLPGVLCGYRHCGQEIYLPPGDGPAIVNPAFLTKLALDGAGLWDGFVKMDEVLISEHFIPNYITRINDQFKPALPAHVMSSTYHEP